MSPIVFAYLDPGASSMMLQAIVAGFAGVMVLGKIARESLWRFFATRFSRLSGARK